MDAVPVHLFQPLLGIPARRIDVTEETVADHDVGLAWFSVLDRRPVRRAKPRRQIRPSLRKEMIVNVDNRHLLPFAGMDRAAVFTFTQNRVAVELVEKWW